MNRVNQEILEELLKNVAYWDKKTSKIERNRILHDLHIIREGRFYDEVYWPYFQKVTNSLHNKPVFFPIEWEELDVGFSQTFKVWYPHEDLYECREWLNDWIQRKLEQQWYGEEWGYEEPTEEELLQLGITPGNIATQAVLIGGVEMRKNRYKGEKLPKPNVYEKKKPVDPDAPTQKSLF